MDKSIRKATGFSGHAYRLLVQPVILDSGISCFPTPTDTLKLRLLETRTFQSGVVYVRYQTDGS